MAGLIEDFGGPLPLEPELAGRPADLYGALLRSITGQQLSVKAAQAIYGRLIERFGGRAPTPEELLADDPEEMRAAAGLSRAKIASLRSLAEHVLGRRAASSTRSTSSPTRRSSASSSRSRASASGRRTCS